MIKTRVGVFREQQQRGMSFVRLTQQNYFDPGLRVVSRGALAAEDLERPQQSCPPVRTSDGNGEVQGGPDARLLGCIWRFDTLKSVAPPYTSITLSADLEGNLDHGQYASHAAEVVVSPWDKRCHERLQTRWTGRGWSLKLASRETNALSTWSRVSALDLNGGRCLRKLSVVRAVVVSRCDSVRYQAD